MEVVKSGRMFMLVLEYKVLMHGFELSKTEDMLLDASQIEVSTQEVVVRRKGRGKGIEEHFAHAMVKEFREVRV